MALPAGQPAVLARELHAPPPDGGVHLACNHSPVRFIRPQDRCVVEALAAGDQHLGEGERRLRGL